MTQNAKGPAGAPTPNQAGVQSYSSPKDQKMNSTDDITAASAAARDFPIPHRAIDATDDLSAARAFFRVIQGEIERSADRQCGMPKSSACDMINIVGEVSARLDTLQRFLDHDAFQNVNTWKLYEKVRRQEILERWEASR